MGYGYGYGYGTSIGVGDVYTKPAGKPVEQSLNPSIHASMLARRCEARTQPLSLSLTHTGHPRSHPDP